MTRSLTKGDVIKLLSRHILYRRYYGGPRTTLKGERMLVLNIIFGPADYIYGPRPSTDEDLFIKIAVLSNQEFYSHIHKSNQAGGNRND